MDAADVGFIMSAVFLWYITDSRFTDDFLARILLISAHVLITYFYFVKSVDDSW